MTNYLSNYDVIVWPWDHWLQMRFLFSLLCLNPSGRWDALLGCAAAPFGCSLDLKKKRRKKWVSWAIYSWANYFDVIWQQWSLFSLHSINGNGKSIQYPFNSVHWLQYKPLLNALRHGILQYGDGGHNSLFSLLDGGEAAAWVAARSWKGITVIKGKIHYLVGR